MHLPHFVYHPLYTPGGSGGLGDCSHGIPTLSERVICSDWFILPPAGACIRPVVMWIWIIDDAHCFSISLPLPAHSPQPVFLSLLCFSKSTIPVCLLSVKRERQAQTERREERERERERKHC